MRVNHRERTHEIKLDDWVIHSFGTPIPKELFRNVYVKNDAVLYHGEPGYRPADTKETHRVFYAYNLDQFHSLSNHHF